MAGNCYDSVLVETVINDIRQNYESERQILINSLKTLEWQVKSQIGILESDDDLPAAHLISEVELSALSVHITALNELQQVLTKLSRAKTTK